MLIEFGGQINKLTAEFFFSI